MAVRALIPAERLATCYVNSNDGSAEYESGIEYKAGTVVTYHGNTYVANIDIEDTDTDTPDEAPEKWGISPNAFGSSGNGDIGDLENRVSTLETKVGDIEDTLTDVDGFMMPYSSVEYIQISADGVKTIAQLMEEMYPLVSAMVAALDDADAILPLKFGVSGTGTLDTTVQLTYITKDSGLSPLYFNAYNAGPTYMQMYYALLTDSSPYFKMTRQAADTTSVQDYSSQVPADGTKVTFFYQRYRKI